MNTAAASSADFSFAPVPPVRAADGISSQIRAAMASGVLKPGYRLPAERTLAAQFGVSRNTVREALRSLQNSGVLDLRRGAHAGAYLKASSGQGVVTGLLDMYQLGGLTPSQLTEARILLETSIVRAACANWTPADLELLKANLKLAVELDREQRIEERIATNLDFHRLVARATHNPLLVTLMEAVLEVMRAFVRSIGPYEAPSVFASRRRFLKLLAARDQAGAAAEMEKSLRTLQKRYLSRLE
jgi:GntR family transcriptional regulator, transcriptional repressor for pyruvate dehydrogenase complex